MVFVTLFEKWGDGLSPNMNKVRLFFKTSLVQNNLWILYTKSFAVTFVNGVQLSAFLDQEFLANPKCWKMTSGLDYDKSLLLGRMKIILHGHLIKLELFARSGPGWLANAPWDIFTSAFNEKVINKQTKMHTSRLTTEREASNQHNPASTQCQNRETRIVN